MSLDEAAPIHRAIRFRCRCIADRGETHLRRGCLSGPANQYHCALCPRWRDRHDRTPHGGRARPRIEHLRGDHQSAGRGVSGRHDRAGAGQTRWLHARLRGAAHGGDSLSRSQAGRRIYTRQLPEDRNAPHGPDDAGSAIRQPLPLLAGSGGGDAQVAGRHSRSATAACWGRRMYVR